MASGNPTRRAGANQWPTTGFDDALTGEMRAALDAFGDAADTCEWCADECIRAGRPELSECIRLCRDVADIGALNAKLIARDSASGPELASVFAAAAEECARECSRHPQRHCQVCADTLTRAVDSTYKMLDRIDQQRPRQRRPAQF